METLKSIPSINAHLHTPYSFSAFRDVDDALDRAVAEGVKVVGINDFYTTQGYEEWAKGCEKRGLYPLFGIELIALDQEDQQAGFRVNDPSNPGRTYLSGKGMTYPFKLPEPHASRLESLIKEANSQVERMCGRLNDVLERKGMGFSIDFNRVSNELSKGLIRERHLAMAVRLKMMEYFNGDEAKIKSALEVLFDGKVLKSSVQDVAGVEGEVRANLLKAGGAAFVPEEPSAFLPVDAVIDIILGAGGIPTYPFLGDDPQGNYTDFEKDLEKAVSRLAERGIHGAEFITTRNDVKRLEEYATYLNEQGFVVTFGSEHNTPTMEPIELFARGGVPLTERLKRINYEGACVIAAHQHVVSQGLDGYVDGTGEADRDRKDEFVKLGDELIRAKINA